MSQAESGASAHQGPRLWRTGISGPWCHQYRDPEEDGQVAGSEGLMEEELANCVEDRTRILRSKKKNQREGKFDQA
jgi:hypothetical protein